MTQNFSESVKIVKNALEANGVYPDAIGKNKDGHIVVRDSFFYKAGRTSEGHTHKVKKALDAAGIKHSIADDGEHWAPFRGGASVARQSHFYTHVRLHEETLSEMVNDVKKISSRSNAFAFTHTPGDSDSEEKLTKLKKMVKAHNNTTDEHSKLRITARGRLGKDNPNADKYRKGGEVWNAKSRPAGTYDADHKWKPKDDGSRKRGDMRDLPMKDAKHHDIYVQPAPKDWDKPGYEERFKKDPYNKIPASHAKSLIAAHKSLYEQITEASLLKQIKRVSKGWGDGINVASVKDDTNSLSKDSLKWSQTRKVIKGSPAHLQQRLAARKLKENLLEKYKRATGRALHEASAQTLVATKGSDKASRYEMHTNMPGEASEYSSIIKTHQDGKPLQNRWGGYNTLRTGKTTYVKKHFDRLNEDLEQIDELGEGMVPDHLYHKPRYVANPSAMQGDHHSTPEQRKAAKAKRESRESVKEDIMSEAPYYSLQASQARMAKEKARAAAKEAVAAAKRDSSIARKEARENRSALIARHIEAEVGNHYPDTDGFEVISNKVRKMGIPHHEVIDHLDKAARKHLGAKSFDHYVDNFHKDAQGSN